MTTYLKTKRDYAVVAVACTGLAVLALAWLHVTVVDWVSGREEYNTPVQFVVGGILGILLGLWPPSRFLTGWKKHVVRAVIFTLCLAPLPFGPEGTLVPSGLGVIFPPLLFMFPQGILITFVATLCLSIATGCVWSILTGSIESKERAEPSVPGDA